MTNIPARDRGLTDPLVGFVPQRLRGLLAQVDDVAGMRVDDDGIHLRQLLRTRTVPWEDVAAIRLDSRLDLLLAAGTRFLPLRRVPVVGGWLTAVVEDAAGAVTSRLAPEVRDRFGWSIATIERHGLLSRDVDVDGGAWLTALFSPSLTDGLVAHARMRHVPVERG